MVFFVVLPDAHQHRHGVLDRRLFYLDRLEPALERLVLFDVLAVLAEGRCADDLNFAAGKRGFQDVGGVHGALRVARAGDVVDFVDEQNDVARGFDLADEAFDAAFKLPAELCARNQCRQVKQVNFFVHQPAGHLALGNAQRNALGNGRFANARLTNEAGVVFLPAAKDLHRAVNFFVAADNAVQLALLRLIGEVFAVGVQKLALFAALFGARVFFVRFVLLFHRGVLGVLCVAWAAHQVKRKRRAAAGGEVVVAGLLFFVPLVPFDRIFACALHKCGKAILHILKVLICDAELLHQIVDRLNSKLFCTGQAIAIGFGLFAVHALDKDHCGPFFAAYT